MKLFIMTDIHGSYKYAKMAIDKAIDLKVNKIVLLGDILYHGPRNDLPEEYDSKKVYELLNSIKDKIIAVKGNCDAEIDEAVLEFPLFPSTIINDSGVELLFTHGHHLSDLDYDGNIVFGHFHKTEFNENYFNIGSVAIPKDGINAYAIYENKKLTAYNLLTDEVIASKEF